MTEQDPQSTSLSGDSPDPKPNRADSSFNSEDVKREVEVEGGIANERDVDLEEASTGQQPLEKPTTATSNASQRDPKLVHSQPRCLPFFAEETNKALHR